MNPSIAAWMSSSFSFIGRSVFPPILIFTRFVLWGFLRYLALNLYRHPALEIHSPFGVGRTIARYFKYG